METFNFSTPGGMATVFFQKELTVPPLPQSGGIYVTDSNSIALLLKSAGYVPSAPTIVIDAGETNKTIASIELILGAALEAGLARDSLFVGVGGGVITDMTAFAASLYMRGALLELVPTTLLAIVDAAIGGKTGVDFQNAKNCIGTFYPASKIHVAVSSIRTLSEREYRSGLAEVLKTALLYAPKLFQILTERKEAILARDETLLLEIIKRCVQAKAHVVERDLKETGERMYLNLGHTFGHALESTAGLGKITHGDAVAWGIARALDLGIRLGVTDPLYRDEVFPVLQSYGWSTSPIHPVILEKIEAGEITEKIVAESLLTSMKKDKKKKGGKVRFVLQREINSTLVTEVEDADVLAILQ